MKSENVWANRGNLRINSGKIIIFFFGGGGRKHDIGTENSCEIHEGPREKVTLFLKLSSRCL
jgi:hypothetical protein